MSVLDIGNEDMYIGLIIGFSVMIGLIIVLCVMWKCCCTKIATIKQQPAGPSKAWEVGMSHGSAWNSNRSAWNSKKKNNYYNDSIHNNTMTTEGGTVKMDESKFLQRYL